jgi:hypothetical protein
MDPKKVRTILEWKTLRSATDVLQFNSFCNFYYCFIKNYLKIVTLLINLTKKNTAFNWSLEC